MSMVSDRFESCAAFITCIFLHYLSVIWNHYFNCEGTVTVLTNDGRHLVGTLRGYDQATNVILDDCHERVYQDDAGVETIVLGLYVIRGDNM